MKGKEEDFDEKNKEKEQDNLSNEEFHQRNEAIRQKAIFYQKNGEDIHITLKNKRFYNGSIVEIRSDFMLIKEDVFGEIPVFFVEIGNIDKKIKFYKESYRS